MVLNELRPQAMPDGEPLAGIMPYEPPFYVKAAKRALFIEVVNTGATAASLAGCGLAAGVSGWRLALSRNIVLDPGSALVIVDGPGATSLMVRRRRSRGLSLSASLPPIS